MRLLGIALVLAACAVARAQQQPEERPRRGEGQGRIIQRIDAIIDELGVNADQRAAIDRILSTARQEARQMMQDAQNMDPRDRRQRAREFMADLRRQIEEQLTPEQKEAFSKRLEQAQARMRENLRSGAGAGAGGQQPPGPLPPPGQDRGQGLSMLGRLSENLSKLDLSPEQKQQADQIIADLRARIREIISTSAGEDRRAVREAAREAVEEARQAIGQVLTPEQRDRLRWLMQAGRPESQVPGRRESDRGARRRGDGRGAGPPDGISSPPDGMSSPPEKRSPGTQPATKPAASAAGGSVLLPGDLAPDFRLRDLSGKVLELSSLGPRSTVLVFGSYTCPHFRDRAGGINRLAGELPGRPNVLVIYTREAHADDEWPVERNRDANIAIRRHQNAEERLAAARQARDALKLSVPILVDDMDDSTLVAYGGHPNAAVVVGGDRRVIAFQRWFEPHGLRRVMR